MRYFFVHRRATIVGNLETQCPGVVYADNEAQALGMARRLFECGEGEYLELRQARGRDEVLLARKRANSYAEEVASMEIAWGIGATKGA